MSSYSNRVLAAGANILSERDFTFKLGRRHDGIERDRYTAVRHILDVVLPIIAAETPLADDAVQVIVHNDVYASESGWGAF
jgi:hypothetical protein